MFHIHETVIFHNTWIFFKLEGITWFESLGAGGHNIYGVAKVQYKTERNLRGWSHDNMFQYFKLAER